MTDQLGRITFAKDGRSSRPDIELIRLKECVINCQCVAKLIQRRTRSDKMSQRCDQIIWQLDEMLELIGPVQYDKECKED